jgi:hypothetical protein
MAKKHDSLELAFVWNRSKEVLKDLDPSVILDDLSECATKCQAYKTSLFDFVQGSLPAGDGSVRLSSKH